MSCYRYGHEETCVRLFWFLGFVFVFVFSFCNILYDIIGLVFEDVFMV